MAVHVVQFVGGPLDGHQHPFMHTPDKLASVAAIPVSPDLLRMIEGQQDQVCGPITSVAVYQLEQEGSRLRYWHVCSVPNEECSCDDN